MENKEIKDEKNFAEEKEANIELNKEKNIVQEKQLSEVDAEEEEKKIAAILKGVLNTNVSKIIKRELKKNKIEKEMMVDVTVTVYY